MKKVMFILLASLGMASCMTPSTYAISDEPNFKEDTSIIIPNNQVSHAYQKISDNNSIELLLH